MSSHRPTLPASAVAFLACAGTIVLLHVWGSLDGSHTFWGTHLFAFLPLWAGAAAFLAAIVLIVPKTQTALTNALERLVKIFASAPLLVGFAVAAALLVGGALLFPSQLHLLGDGALLIRSIPHVNWGDDVAATFRNQPLLSVLYRWAVNFHPSDLPPHPEQVYAVIDLGAALAFLALLFWTFSRLQRPGIERVLLGVLLLGGAGAQFFFGYVENYVLQYVVTAAYAITGWYALERRIPVIVPLLCFAVLPGLNLGTLIFAPSLAYLLLSRYPERKAVVLAGLGALGVISLGALWALGFDFIGFARHLSAGSVDFLEPFTMTPGNWPYAMFSLVHLVDWLNALLLIAPFGLVVPAVILHYLPKAERWKNPALLFLLLTAACGLTFTWIINSALGMARDWDMLASFFVPLMVLDAMLLAHPLVQEPRRYAIALVTGLTVLHTAAFIAVNADAERHMARFKTLDDTRYLSFATQMAYNEALANHFFDHANYPEAKHYYRQYMKIDSFNPRILGNISDVYRKLGEKGNYFETLKRAVRLNNPNPGVYSNLGVEYASRGDTTNAILYNEKALALDPNLPKAHANLGILYMSKRDFVKADRHFRTAVELGMRDPILFRYAGDVAVLVDDLPRAVRYYDLCLELNPGNARVRDARERLRAALARSAPR